MFTSALSEREKDGKNYAADEKSRQTYFTKGFFFHKLGLRCSNEHKQNA